jgi:hypothetical protein
MNSDSILSNLKKQNDEITGNLEPVTNLPLDMDKIPKETRLKKKI